MILTIEQMQEIVDGAPEWAKSYCIEAMDYWNEESKYPCCVDVLNLKAKIDQHYYGQSEEKELEQYALLSQEKIEGGTALVGCFGDVREKIDAINKERDELLVKVGDALNIIRKAKDGFYGFSCEGVDTDNLTKDLEKALRGNSNESN